MRGSGYGLSPLVACTVAALALLAPASADADTPARERYVNVYNWSDYIDPTCLTPSQRGQAFSSTHIAAGIAFRTVRISADNYLCQKCCITPTIG